MTWQVPHEPPPYTVVRFVRYWGCAKDTGTPTRITDVNKSNTTAVFLFIYCIIVSPCSLFGIVTFVSRFLLSFSPVRSVTVIRSNGSPEKKLGGFMWYGGRRVLIL
jgi:hypothetical protein